VGIVRLMYDNGATRRVRVTVGKTVRSRDAMAEQLWQPQLVRQIEMIALAVALVCIGLTFELRPLMKVKEEVADRDPMQLEPIRVDRLHTELRPIVEAINQCIARLGVQVAAQRRFIADAAHQLRTPLAGLRSQTELALGQRDPATMQRTLERLAVGTEHATALANRLLTLARAGTYVRSKQADVDLVALAKDVIADHLPAANARAQDLGFEGPSTPGAIIVHGDQVLLRELLSNLLDNAVRYTPERGLITVEISRDRRDNAVIAVHDTGPGVPDDERAKVFEPFYRGRDAVATGTGLGLAIVRTIADAHGASVSLQTNPDGVGLCVAANFPTHAEAVA